MHQSRGCRLTAASKTGLAGVSLRMHLQRGHGLHEPRRRKFISPHIHKIACHTRCWTDRRSGPLRLTRWRGSGIRGPFRAALPPPRQTRNRFPTGLVGDLRGIRTVARYAKKKGGRDRSIGIPPGGDRGFESSSLQQRVCLTGVFGDSRRKSPAFGRGCESGRDQRTGRAARTRLALAPFSDGH